MRNEIPPSLKGVKIFPMISILAALEYRRKTKKGMFIDSAMLPGSMILLMMVFGKFFLTGEELYQENDRMTGKYPNYTLYETKDKRYMAVAAIEPKFWNEFCKGIKKPEFEKWIPLTDKAGFPTPSLAKKSEKELHSMKQRVGFVFKTKNQKEWIKIFKRNPNGCVTPVQNFGEAIQFLKWLGQKDLMYIKDPKGRVFPQWLFPFGNQQLSRRSHTLPPLLKNKN